MSTDQEQRVRAAVRAYLDAVPVSPPPAAALRRRAGTAVVGVARPWLAPALAGLAVLALLGLSLLATAAPAPVSVDPGAGDARPVLPTRIHGGIWRTAEVTGAPPGAVIAIFSHATARTIGQPVLVAADGHTYRQLDGADYSLLSGAGAAALLPSPEGTRMAGVDGRVLDLETGRIAWHRLLARDTARGGAASPPLAWSPDGRWLAFGLAASDVPRPATSREEGGGLALLDLDTGEVRFVDTGAGLYQQVAFSPAGDELAVAIFGQSAADQPQTRVLVFTLTGQLVRELPPLPGGQPAWHGAAWSPDGALLAVPWEGPDGKTWFEFLDPTGAGAPVPEPFSLDHTDPVDLLGWRGPDSLLLGVHRGQTGPRWLVEEPVADGGSIRAPLDRLVSQFRVDDVDRIGHLRLATGLTEGAEIREAGRPRHGPLPRAVGLAAATAAVVGAAVSGVAWSRWRAAAVRKRPA